MPTSTIPKTITLEYDGYWSHDARSGVPPKSGTYCVYAGTQQPNNRCSLRKLIYIGESTDVRARLTNHEKIPDWKKHLGSGERLYYSFAPIVTDRVRAEAALIYKHKPPENTEYVDHFPFPRTTMRLSGKTMFLIEVFTVG